MVLKTKNVKNLTFERQKTTLTAIQPNPPYDMLFMSSQRSVMQNKIYTSKNHMYSDWITLHLFLN